MEWGADGPHRHHKVHHKDSCTLNTARCPPLPDSSEGKSWWVEAGLVSLRFYGISPWTCLSSTFLEGPLDFPGPCCAAVFLVELGWVGLGWVGLG